MPELKDKQLATAQQEVMARYPEFAALISGDAAGIAKLRAEFGDDLVDLLLDYLADGKRKKDERRYDLTTNEGANAFMTKVASTSYYVNTAAAQEKFDLQSPADKKVELDELAESITSKYGELGLSQSQIQSVALRAAKGGHKADSLRVGYMVNEIAASAPEGSTAMTSGDDAMAIKKIASEWNFPQEKLDQVIKTILTAKPDKHGVVLTKEGFEAMAKKSAMGLYPHLIDQFNAGLTLDDVFSNYKSITAKLLEKSEDEIDVSDPLYSAALGTPTTGQMSLADWQSKLMKDERYGYHKTKQANKDMTNLGLIIANAFGKVG